MFGSFVAGGGDPGESWPVVRARDVRSVGKMTIVSFERWDWDKRGLGRWGENEIGGAGPDLSRESSRLETAQRGRAGGAVGGIGWWFVVGGLWSVHQPLSTNHQPIWPSTINQPDSTREGPGPGCLPFDRIYRMDRIQDERFHHREHREHRGGFARRGWRKSRRAIYSNPPGVFPCGSRGWRGMAARVQNCQSCLWTIAIRRAWRVGDRLSDK